MYWLFRFLSTGLIKRKTIVGKNYTEEDIHEVENLVLQEPGTLHDQWALLQTMGLHGGSIGI